MKKFYVILITLFAINAANAQSDQVCLSCLTEGIVFYNQSQIDNFQTNYPNCTQIEGNVLISGNGITNLNGLNVLTSIGGNLTISSTGNLYSLSGLNNLIYVGHDLGIRSNSALNSLAGMESLDSIGLAFEIRYNPTRQI